MIYLCNNHFMATFNCHIHRENLKAMKQILLFILLATSSFIVNGQVSGVVYKDYNASGTRDNTVGTLVEPLVSGITVKAYSATGALLATTTTTSTGPQNYSFAGLTLPVRIEFSGLPASYLPSCATDQTSLTGSSVQFISAATTAADFRINNPDDYSQPNPLVISARNIIGTASGTTSTLRGSYYNNATYTTSGSASNLGFTSNTVTGTTWGLAYSRKTKTLFNAAVTRNYMDFGPGGFDAIYTFTFNDANDDAAPAATLTAGTTIDLSTLGVTVGTSPRSAAVGVAAGIVTDNSDLYQKVGKIGIGDIDVNAGGDTLYVVNMNDGAPTLVILNVNNPAAVTLIAEVAMPNPGCTNGVFRPWALNFHEGKLYVGGVCDASTGTAANLQAYVYRYDGGTTFTQVVSMPLNYARGKSTFRNDGTFQAASWLPWTNTWNPNQLTLAPANLVSQPQPMLTDIEFTEDGSMILGFGDRFSFQTAHAQNQYGTSTGAFSTVAAGDIKKLCNVAGSFVLEGTAGSCVQNNYDNGSASVGGTIAPTAAQIGAAVKEFFDDDFYNTGNSSVGQAGHSETAAGALAVLPGKDQLVATGFDAVSTSTIGGASGPVNTSGVRFYNSTNGNQVKGWVMVEQTDAGSNRKGNNMGDIEILCNPAPIEIGNRIWNDANANGIQDPGETTFANVTVELYLDANNDCIPDAAALATVTTDANGQYIFSNQVTGEYVAGDPGFGHAKFNITQLVPNQNYIVRIGAADWNSVDGEGTGDLANYHLTTANVVGSGLADWSDSDATLANITGSKYAQICVTTGMLGSNDHNQDFGLKNTISLCGNVWNDLNANASTVGSPDGAEQVINGTNTGAGVTTGTTLYANLINASNNVIATTPINADGTYCFPLVSQKTSGLLVQLTTNQGTVGQIKPATSVPTGWVTTGENKNSQGGTADGTANSEIPVVTTITDITLQNFGIQQVPESAIHEEVIGENPGGTVCTSVNPLWFETSNVGANPNTQDYSGGTVASIRLTSFPTNATSITINGTNYTSVTFPLAGITIPYTPGTGPTQAICVDPINGTVTVDISFKSIDNGGAEDPSEGRVSLTYSTTLPVNLVSFTAVKNANQTVDLKWIVTAQVNLNKYEIQRSADGINFKTIGVVNATNKTTYDFNDVSPIKGFNYYRLKEIDNNGSSKLTAALRISFGKTNIQVYPNLVKDVITISGLQSSGKMKIFSASGLLIDEIKVNANSMQYDVSQLPSGSYFIKYNYNNNLTTIKFFKN
jgi:hypothetical protein